MPKKKQKNPRELSTNFLLGFGQCPALDAKAAAETQPAEEAMPVEEVMPVHVEEAKPAEHIHTDTLQRATRGIAEASEAAGSHLFFHEFR